MNNAINIVTEMRDFAAAEIKAWCKRQKRKPRKGLSVEAHRANCDVIIQLWIHREQAYEYVLDSLRHGSSIHA